MNYFWQIDSIFTILSSTVGPPPGAETVEGITVGSRCEVQPGGRRGVVMFVGEATYIKNGGYWVSILRFCSILAINLDSVRRSE